MKEMKFPAKKTGKKKRKNRFINKDGKSKGGFPLT